MKCDAICFSDHAVIITEDNGGDEEGGESEPHPHLHSQELHQTLGKLNWPNFLWKRE